MLFLVEAPVPYCAAYKPNVWGVRSSKFPVNTTPGESDLPIFAIAVADAAAVIAQPGLVEGDIFVVLAGTPAPGAFEAGQTVILDSTTAGRYDGIHRITKVVAPGIFVIDATNIDGSFGGNLTKYYERYRVIFKVQFQNDTEAQEYIVDADPDGIFRVDIRKQAQRTFADVFDVCLPNTLVGATDTSGRITQRYTITAQEGYNIPTNGFNDFTIPGGRENFPITLPPAQGKFNVVVNAVQPYHHTDEFDGGTDLDWNDNLAAYIVSPTTTGQIAKRFLTYAPDWNGRDRGITIAPGEDYFLSFLHASAGQTIRARFTFFNGGTFLNQADSTFILEGESMAVACGPANIFVPATCTHYLIELRNENGQPITRTYRFNIDRKCYRSPRRFFALNKLGGIDAWTFTGFEKRENNYQRETKSRTTMPARIPKEGSYMRKMWKVDPARMYSITSQALPKAYLRYVADEILESPDIRIIMHKPATLGASVWWTTVIPMNDTNDMGFEHGTLRIDYMIGVDNQVQRR
jgi:hypothetical protein